MNFNEEINTDRSLSVYCLCFQTDKRIIAMKYLLPTFFIIFDFHHLNVSYIYGFTYSRMTSFVFLRLLLFFKHFSYSLDILSCYLDISLSL